MNHLRYAQVIRYAVAMMRPSSVVWSKIDGFFECSIEHILPVMWECGGVGLGINVYDNMPDGQPLADVWAVLFAPLAAYYPMKAKQLRTSWRRHRRAAASATSPGYR